ncbi:MAG: DUF2974 domain-containing protein [Erysipelotrichaceae bacterium]|nr:DUF2974 domain-containing protein [Erysipelotrichaceae bacterium]
MNLRGDLTIDKDPYNELEALVFSLISYFDLSAIISSNILPLTIKEAYKRYESLHLGHLDNNNDILFQALASAKRYQNIRIISFISELDKEMIKQFAAITLLLDDETMVVSYRGTDDSLIGWHEDFLMLCDDVIPAQESALAYLNSVNKYQISFNDFIYNPYLGNILQRIHKYITYKRNRPLWLLGHSKGGNLAMYAGSLARSDIQNRIISIDNFDGPGFQETMLTNPGYQRILPKIQSTILHYSFFGMILGHEEKCKVIESQNIGMYQHDAYSWCINHHGFKVSTLSDEVIQFSNEVQNYLDSLTNEEKHQFVQAMFDLFDKLNIHYFSQLSNISPKHILNGLKEITMIDTHTRKILIDVINMLWKESAKAKGPITTQSVG